MQWDLQVFVPLPGTGGKVATTRATLKACQCCGNRRFEVVTESRRDADSGRVVDNVSVLCPRCCPVKPGVRRRLLGRMDSVTGEDLGVSEAGD